MVRYVFDVDFAFIGYEVDNREDDEVGKDVRGIVGVGYDESVFGRER